MQHWTGQLQCTVYYVTTKLMSGHPPNIITIQDLKTNWMWNLILHLDI